MPTPTSASPTIATAIARPDAIPGNRLGLGLDQRVDHFEHARQQRQLEQLTDARIRRDQREAAIQSLRRGVAAHQRANAGAVGGRHAAQIDHDVLVAGLEDFLDAAFELFGGSAGDQRFLRRQDHPIDLAGFAGNRCHDIVDGGETVPRMVKLGKG